MKNKRGWIRILEATIAIMLVSGVLLVMSSRNVQESDISERVYAIQKEILLDIGLDDTLRNYVLVDDEDALEEYADSKIPDAFDFVIRVCDLNSDNTIGCNLNEEEIRETRDKDVYADGIVVSGSYDNYDVPKRVNFFIWEVG